MGLRFKLAAAFGVAALILVMGGFALRSMYVTQAWSQQVTRSSELIDKLDALERAILDAETSQRSYLLMGYDRYLGPYRAAATRARQALAALAALTRAEPERHAALADQIDAKLAELAAAIDQHDRVSPAAALAMVSTDSGAVAMATIRTLIDDQRTREDLLRQQRGAQREQAARLTEWIVGLGSALAFALAVVTNLGIAQSVGERERARVQLTQQAAALATLASEREEQAAALATLASEREEQAAALATLASEREEQAAALATLATEREEQATTLAIQARDLAESRERLAAQLVQAQKLNLLLEKSNRDLDQFAYVASHDLKAPLRGIANLASWIEDDLSTSMTPATQEKLELLRGRVLRMEALIEGILTYSRAGRVRENLQMVDVALLVADVLELSPPPPEVAVEVGSLPTFATEKVELQQVFMNLLSNAFKHARKAGARVTVTARDQPAGWQFAVTDNGPGIDSKYQTRIFGIFQTLASRDKVEGTGIGLAVVKKLVEGRGGHVWVESQPGAGATFLFTWPERTRGQDAA